MPTVGSGRGFYGLAEASTTRLAMSCLLVSYAKAKQTE